MLFSSSLEGKLQLFRASRLLLRSAQTLNSFFCSRSSLKKVRFFFCFAIYDNTKTAENAASSSKALRIKQLCQHGR